MCVLHTHSSAGSAVSAMACGLLPISQHSHMFIGEVGYHDFSGPVVDLAQQGKLVEDLGSHQALIMRNHGLLVCGRSIAEAFVNIYWLESACRIQVAAIAGGDVIVPSDEVIAASRAVVARGRHSDMRGRREFAAVMRDLDRTDPSYLN